MGHTPKLRSQRPCPLRGFHISLRRQRLYMKLNVLLTGDIVHINGPFRAGDWPGIAIFRDRLIGMLDEGERVEADDGYRSKSASIKIPAELLGDGSIAVQWAQCRRKRIVQVCHETVNHRFKQFNCLKAIYRYDLNQHHAVFRGCVSLTQIGINHGDFICHVEYQILM